MKQSCVPDDNTADWAATEADNLFSLLVQNPSTVGRQIVAEALRSAHSRGVEEECRRVLAIVTKIADSNVVSSLGWDRACLEIARRIKEGE